MITTIAISIAITVIILLILFTGMMNLSQSVIIQDNKNPEYPEYIKVEVIQDKVSLLDNINIGDEINVLINIKGRKWEDKEGNIKYFNSIQGWKIESENLNLNQDNNDDNFNQDSGEDLPF